MKKLILILATVAFGLSMALPTIEAAVPAHAKISVPHAKSAQHRKAKRPAKRAHKKQAGKASGHRH